MAFKEAILKLRTGQQFVIITTVAVLYFFFISIECLEFGIEQYRRQQDKGTPLFATLTRF
jgi:hypothetical protein